MKVFTIEGYRKASVTYEIKIAAKTAEEALEAADRKQVHDWQYVDYTDDGWIEDTRVTHTEEVPDGAHP